MSVLRLLYHYRQFDVGSAKYLHTIMCSTKVSPYTVGHGSFHHVTVYIVTLRCFIAIVMSCDDIITYVFVIFYSSLYCNMCTGLAIFYCLVSEWIETVNKNLHFGSSTRNSHCAASVSIWFFCISLQSKDDMDVQYFPLSIHLTMHLNVAMAVYPPALVIVALGDCMFVFRPSGVGYMFIGCV